MQSFSLSYGGISPGEKGSGVKNEGSMGFTCGTMATDVKATDDLKGQGVIHLSLF